MITPRGALWRLLLTTAVVAVLATLIINVLRQPVAEPTHAYTAEFTDASGVRPGTDVRVRGVRVGKVESVRVLRRAGQSLAEVGFTMQDRFAVVPESRLAVKFAALTGLRYLEMIDPADTDIDGPVPTLSALPAAMTRPMVS